MTARAWAWIEVACAEGIRQLPTAAQAKITWLIREAGTNSEAGATGQVDGTAGAVLAAVRHAQLPSGKPYAWIAGEVADVRALRRHLLRERGFERNAVVFTGYWRCGAGEDDLLVERFGDGAADQG